MKDLVKQYVDSLPPKEKQAFEIAKSHLGTLFNIEKTNGFLQWKQQSLKTNK
jgi:hypothetical protein